MIPIQVMCRFTPDWGWIRLRELSGFDEQMVRDTHTGTAVELLNRLVVEPFGGRGVASRSAMSLTASDRDRLLAHVYSRNFGRKVQSTVRCVHCRELFDLEFDIEQLARVLDPPWPACVEALADRTFRLPMGVRFRLPTGEDEVWLSETCGTEPERALALLQRCLIEPQEGVSERELAAVEEAMEEIAPVLDLDLGAQCPECRTKQPVYFSVQFYLLRAIQQGWKQTVREVHLLATAYGWTLQEILGLPRSQRRQFVQLIETERSTRRKAYA
jgi:hypothetical protein